MWGTRTRQWLSKWLRIRSLKSVSTKGKRLVSLRNTYRRSIKHSLISNTIVSTVTLLIWQRCNKQSTWSVISSSSSRNWKANNTESCKRQLIPLRQSPTRDPYRTYYGKVSTNPTQSSNRHSLYWLLNFWKTATIQTCSSHNSHWFNIIRLNCPGIRS